MALIEQKEAARLLGVSEEEIKNMVSQQELFGYRDGSAWKFKKEELERVADERGIELGASPPPGTAGGSGIDDDLYGEMVDVTDLPEDDESILVSEEALGRSGISTSSTIIGSDEVVVEEGSDIQKAIDGGTDIEEADLSLGDSGIDLEGGSDLLAGSDVAAVSDLDLGDDILGDADEDKKDDALSLDSDASLSLDDDDDDDVLGGGSASASGGLDSMLGIDLGSDITAGSDVGSATGDDDALLELDDEGDDETPTQLAGSLDSDTSFELGEEDDDDFVIGAGSDVTLGVGDSGIGLSTPKDSGISLEDDEPLDLMGSQVGELELGEGDLELDEDADPEASTQLKAEDDFGLTPVDMDLEEESDSGSQVIALDTEQFDETADTMLQAAPAMLEEDDLMDDQFGDDPLGAGAPGAGAGLAGSPMMQHAPAVPEAKFSIWNVLSLMVIMLMLTLTGMLMVDVIMNMWEFDQTTTANRTLMEKVLSIMGE